MRRSIFRSNAPGSSFSARSRSPSRRACSSPGAWWVPIQTLPAGAAHLGSGDLGRRIAIKSGDEVEALAAQFNDMAGRLQEFMPTWRKRSSCAHKNFPNRCALRRQEIPRRRDAQRIATHKPSSGGANR